MYGGICNPRTANNIYTLGPEKAMPKESIPTATLPDQYKVPHRLKPLELPELDKTKGVHTYLTLWEEAIRGAIDSQMASDLLNSIDAATAAILTPNIPRYPFGWRYEDVKNSLIKLYTLPNRLNTQVMEFMAIKFKPNKTVNEFAGRFLLDAQILYNAYAINNFNVNVAMKQAVAPYHNLAMIMNHAIDENRNAKELVEWMSKSAHLFKEPPLKSQTKVNNPTT